MPSVKEATILKARVILRQAERESILVGLSILILIEKKVRQKVIRQAIIHIPFLKSKSLIMSMLKLYFLLVFILPFSASYAQKVIIVDTLIGYNSALQSSNQLLQSCYISIEDFEKEQPLDVTYYAAIYPNVIARNVIADEVCILLDDRGGNLMIRNIQGSSDDTIRISRWKIYSNGLTDTLSGSKAYYQMYNDSIVRTSPKIVPFKMLIKNKGKKKLNEICLCVNGRYYKLPVTTITERSIETFHGYEPLNIYKQYMSNQNPKKTYSYKKFEGTQTRITRKFSATLTL